MSNSSNSKSFGRKKIPYNFTMWKTKVMVVLETIDYEMKIIVEKGLHVPMYQPMANNNIMNYANLVVHPRRF